MAKSMLPPQMEKEGARGGTMGSPALNGCVLIGRVA